MAVQASQFALVLAARTPAPLRVTKVVVQVLRKRERLDSVRPQVSTTIIGDPS